MVGGVIEADLVLINGKIITVDKVDSIVEAVAVKDNRIIATGSTSKVNKLVGEVPKSST